MVPMCAGLVICLDLHYTPAQKSSNTCVLAQAKGACGAACIVVGAACTTV